MANMTPASGNWTTVREATKASTAYAVGDALQNDGTNNIRVTSSSDLMVGIAAEAKAATVATTASILMWVPRDKSATFFADVTSGTLTKAMEGKLLDFTDHDGINAGATTEKVVRCVRYISASRGEFSLDVGKNT